MWNPLQPRHNRRTRNQRRHLLAGDPMQRISSPATAIDIAEALLESAPRTDPAEQFWQVAAVRPLAALLYAGTLQHSHDRTAWVAEALDNTFGEDTAVAWYTAADLCRAAPADTLASRLLARDLAQLGELSTRQRLSVTHVMRQAISPFSPPPRKPRTRNVT
jgi:hypothetical protein